MWHSPGMTFQGAAGAAFVLLAVLSSSATAQAGAEVLTNDAVVQMVAGKLSKDLILSKIQNTPNSFDLTSGAVIKLTEGKVPHELIMAMLKAKPVKPVAAEVLTNETVVKMLTANVSKDIIVAKIQAGKNAFDVTAAGLVSLNQSKVPQDIIKLMMAPAGPPRD